jgi:L-arabinose isomerase
MIDLQNYEIWFLTGSQQLYGPETLEQVAQHSEEIVRALNDSGAIPARVVFKPVLTTSEEIHGICMEANATRPTVWAWWPGCIPSRPRATGSPAGRAG